MKILIVEDDAFYAQYIAEMLQDRGVESGHVSSAQEALAANISDYDGAVVDVMLPNDPAASGITEGESRGGFFTGVAVARRLLAKNGGLRVVFLSAVGNAEAEAWAASKAMPFVRKSDRSETLFQALKAVGLLGEKETPLAFIVHGHDDRTLLELKNYLQNTLGWREPIVLREQPSSGRTVIEKFEDHAHAADCVFVLLTPDDRVVPDSTNDEKRRSRQNVIFEMGFFYSALERRSGRVIVLHKGAIELPSDIDGVVWIDITGGIDAAGEAIRKEAALFASPDK